MAFHFVSNAAFVHNHIIDGESISHAHPFTGNRHNASDATQIQHFNITPCIEAPAVEVPACIEIASAPVHVQYSSFAPAATIKSILLRGPPAIF